MVSTANPDISGISSLLREVPGISGLLHKHIVGGPLRKHFDLAAQYLLHETSLCQQEPSWKGGQFPAIPCGSFGFWLYKFII